MHVPGNNIKISKRTEKNLEGGNYELTRETEETRNKNV